MLAVQVLPSESYHHIPYSFGIKCEMDKVLNIDIQYYAFRKANYIVFNNFLGCVNWDNGINLALNEFYCHFQNNFPNWFSSELKFLIINKKKLHTIGTYRVKASEIIKSFPIFAPSVKVFFVL